MSFVGLLSLLLALVRDIRRERHYVAYGIIVSLPSLREAGGGSTRKKALAFGKGVGKTVVFLWRKVGKP
jgi:hypothetical protein